MWHLRLAIVFIGSCKIGGHLETVATHAFACLLLHLCFFNNTNTICNLGQCNSNASIFKFDHDCKMAWYFSNFLW